MSKFRKKPVEVEAVQFTGSNFNEIARFIEIHGGQSFLDGGRRFLVTTVHGDEATVAADDWIIPDGKPGTFYPVKPDIFAATYDAVEDEQDAREGEERA